LAARSRAFAIADEFDGFRVPSSVEVTWNLPEGPFSYARFHITALEYNVTEPF